MQVGISFVAGEQIVFRDFEPSVPSSEMNNEVTERLIQMDINSIIACHYF